MNLCQYNKRRDKPMTANMQSQAIVRVVDDDPDVRRSWQFVIEGEGWNVLTYASALEFLEKDSPFAPGVPGA